MTMEKFDGSIGRVASVVSIVLFFRDLTVGLWLYLKCGVSLEYLLAHVLVVMGLIVGVCYAISRFWSLKGKGILDSAARKANQVDYKYCADVNAPGIHDFLKKGYNIDIFNLGASDPVIIPAKDSRYCSASQFFLNETIMRDFACVPIKNNDKKGKCILQVLYVPIDADGRVPVILRMPDQHASVGEDKPQFTFVSFSPVPRRYEAVFDPLDCYHREVPSTPSQIEEYGMAISKQGATWYLFYIFFARYEKSQFMKDDEMNRQVMEQVFSVGDGKMFAKDHDEILHVATFKDLYKAVFGVPCEDPVLAKLMSKTSGRRKFVRMENGKPCMTFRFDLSKAVFKGVEKELVKIEGKKA